MQLFFPFQKRKDLFYKRPKAFLNKFLKKIMKIFLSTKENADTTNIITKKWKKNRKFYHILAFYNENEK
jgi:hypothetical protein